MFEFFRQSKLVKLLLLSLLVLAFAIVGVESYSRFMDQGATVASVDGKPIRQVEWDAAHTQESAQMRQSMPNLDPKLLDSPEAKFAALERLVRQKVMAAAADKQRLHISDQRLALSLNENPSIAALRKPDGSLDMEQYKLLVGPQGVSPEGFEARVRQDLSMRQVLAGISESGFVSNATAELILNPYLERREIQIQRFNSTDFASKVSPTDAQIEAFYKANPRLFQAPETASVEYLVLDLDAAKKGISLKADEVKAYYEQNASRLSGQEERRASHILINAPKSASAANRAAAQAKAQALLAQLKAAPESFADLARKNSQDPGSAANGGDLDFFGRGAMVKPFEDSVFSLQKGQTSPVVETDFGYHIIRLTDIRAPKQKSFEEAKPEIEAELLKQQAQKKFAELAENFTNVVYEQSESLQPAAERFGLQIKTASNIRRSPQAGSTGPLTNAAFLNALFSADAIEKKRNTQALETGPNQLSAGRIVQHAPARTLPLAEVKASVRERVVAEQAAALAKADGAATLGVLQAKPDAGTWPAAVTVSREQAQGLPKAVVEAALRADASRLPAIAGVDLQQQGYMLIRVNKVLGQDAKPANANQAIAARWSNAEVAVYYETLKKRLKAEYKVSKPEKKPEAATP